MIDSVDRILAYGREARAAGREAGIGEAARAASAFSLEKEAIHPDIPWDAMNAPAKMAMHATAQLIAEKILALLEPKEEK